MSKRHEIRLAGTGGQGIILAGVLLAEAAVRDGLNVVQTQSYGPEARGGASRSEVIISDGEIDYPKVIEADMMLCLSQEACDRYSGRLRKDGMLVIDADLIRRAPTTRAVRVSLTRKAEQTVGESLTANVVGLGVLAGLAQVVSRESLEAAIRARVPPSTTEINLKALAVGYEIAEQIKKDTQ
ncbi:MAG: 2-oxoacid:acceptor oxidoreductase family protein [Anaerolineae bacterium]|nr:2-oxoacid:acceptor oxidoreductase family protein [Anaerolineae bacterium]